MQPNEVMTDLRKLFSATKAQRILPILRRDGLLWNALLEEGFFAKVAAFAADDPALWSPAYLALIAIVKHPEKGQSIAQLRKSAMKDVGEPLRLFDETRQIVRQPKNLVDAGRLALAMHDRFIGKDQPRGLLQEIMPLPGEAERPAMLIWQTPISILLGMIDDPLEFLRTLMPKRISPLVQQWVCNAVLSNPYEAEFKVQLYSALFAGLPPAQQLSWMRQINFIESKAVVADVARQLLTKTSLSSAQLLSKTNLDMIDIETAIVRSLEMQRLAGLYRFADQPANARVMLQKAQSIVQHWMAGLGLQTSDLNAVEGQAQESLAALQNALMLGGEANGMQSEILLSVPELDQVTCVVEQLPEQTSNPISQIFMAYRIAKNGDAVKGRELAKRAVELWMGQINRQPLAINTQFAMNWRPINLATALLELQLRPLAIQVATKLVEMQPADPTLNLLLSEMQDQEGNTRMALLYGQFAGAIVPEDSQIHAWESTLWGKLGEWEMALQAQQQAISLKDRPEANDWVKLARCAVMLKHWSQVEEAAEHALAMNPELGAAMAMKGQAFLETGKLDEAGHLLSRGTMLAPEEADGWLQLARLYHRTHNDQRALETLRAAVLAVPASAEINFALGRSYLSQGQTSEALPFLRQAASLDQNSVDIAVDLGETLTILGHCDEALQLIEQARVQWPQHPRLAYTHAQAALSVSNRELALSALEVALDADEPQPEWYLLFARTILGKELYRPTVSKNEYAWLIKGEQALEKALSVYPHHFETHLLLAEVTLRKGNFAQAYELFEQLMDEPEFQSTEFRWRVQAGVGQVSLNLKHYEHALASLEDAVQDQPENLYLQHLLAEAYLMSRLEKQAMQTARYSMALMPDDLENLVWFGEIMARLGEWNDAVVALRTASQLAPESAELWLKMAELNLKLKEPAAARENLQKLLTLSSLNSTILLQAAKLFLSIDDYEEVLNCLLKIDRSDLSVQLQIAYFSLQTNHLDIGLKAIQEAAQNSSNETAVYVVESDMLVHLQRTDAALACLEHAIHLAESNERSTAKEAQVQWERILENDLVPGEWLASIQTVEAIHSRLTSLFRSMGDLLSALHHAEQALECNPESAALRFTAAELNEALMQFDRQEALLVGQVFDENGFAEEATPETRQAMEQMLAMQAEFSLQKGNYDQAREILATIPDGQIVHPRLVAVQARIEAKAGHWEKAGQLLEAADSQPGVWYGVAALEMFLWDKGLSMLEVQCNRQPSNYYAQYWLARGLASAALMRKSGLLLKLRGHLPGEHVVSEKAQTQFERAANAAIKSGHIQADHWQVMGRAIYQPGLQTIRSLAAILPGEAEAMVLVAVLREITNIAGAIQVAEEYQESAGVLLQQALCYLAQESRAGLEVALKAAVLEPDQPLFQALLARASQEAGLAQEALESIENALEMWPEEAEWHRWAGQLAQELGLEEQVVDHWDQVLKWMPVHQEIAIEAGHVYLTHGQEHKAIFVLEEATRQDPACVEGWYLLGEAYSQSGQLKQGLMCAEKAAALDPENVKRALLCGEIAMKMGRNDEALQWGQKAIVQDPTQPEAVLFVANVFAARNNLGEAFSIIEKSISKNIVSKDMLLKRAWLMVQLHGFQMALPELKNLNNAYPSEAPILKLLSQAFMESGDLVQAEFCAAQALAVDPNQPAMNILMGKLQRMAGQLDQSIHYLSEAIRQQPDRIEAYLELGQVYVDKRESFEALQTYQKAMKAVPQDFRPYYQAGLILREGKEYHGAETMLRRAAELSPDDLNIRRQLGAVITLNLIHSSQEASSTNESQHTPVH